MSHRSDRLAGSGKTHLTDEVTLTANHSTWACPGSECTFEAGTYAADPTVAAAIIADAQAEHVRMFPSH